MSVPESTGAARARAVPDAATITFPTLRTPDGTIPAGAPAWNPQRGSRMPFHRYRPAHERVEVTLPDRTWPTRRITRAPLWVPVDLRDGNQALVEPMDTARKMRAFCLQVAMGFKEIEVGYPSASSLEHDFVRQLATHDLVPDDVTPVVFTPARSDLIIRTFDAICGLPRAVVHMYTATAPAWRDVVLGRDHGQLKELILQAGAQLLAGADSVPGTAVRFQFSPEVFNLTEPQYVLDVCNALTVLWDASADRPVTHNLPATVEIATPNVYADQIEWMDRHLDRRNAVILSVHPHNDRGTGVACAELAMLAGAQRVEGCLFGNGERTGNVDLVTLALNLFSQGIDPMIDFSDLDAIRRTVEHCNGLPVHDRHPYGGDLVHTAFSGTHQDAIRKGFTHHAARAAALGLPPRQAPWDVPYLPIDPADIGRSYEAVIRINSQSGKGGVAYLLAAEHGLTLPRRMQIEFSSVVQEASETTAAGGEITGARLWELFTAEYLRPGRPVRLKDCQVQEGAAGSLTIAMTLDVGGQVSTVVGKGDSAPVAVADALIAARVDVEILDHVGQPIAGRSDGMPVAYAEVRCSRRIRWGAGRDADASAATVQAVLSAVNRAITG